MRKKTRDAILRRWNKKGYPHKGWIHMGVDDLENNSGVCSMCGKVGLRYIHNITHSSVNRKAAVGSKCASRLTQDYETAENKNREAVNRANRKRRFLKKAWNIAGEFENAVYTLASSKMTFTVRSDDRGYLTSEVKIHGSNEMFETVHDYQDLELIKPSLFDFYDATNLDDGKPI